MNNNKTDSRQAGDVKNKPEMSEAEIDENLRESFPASDPPSWTLGTNHRAETETETETDKSQKD